MKCNVNDSTNIEAEPELLGSASMFHGVWHSLIRPGSVRVSIIVSAIFTAFGVTGVVVVAVISAS